MTTLLLAARFLLELALLAGLAIGGWTLPQTRWAQIVLALALPAIAAALWGLLVSPKAKYVTPLPVRVVVEVALFASAAIVLWQAEFTTFAVVLLGLEFLVLVSLLGTGHPPGPGQAITAAAPHGMT